MDQVGLKQGTDSPQRAIRKHFDHATDLVPRETRRFNRKGSKALFQQEFQQNGGFTTTWDTRQGGKTFLLFKEGRDAFLRHLLELPVQSRNAYEIIWTHLPCLAYVDVDYKNHVADADHTRLIRVLRDYAQTIRQRFAIEPAFKVLCGTRTKEDGAIKHSYHIIVANLAFRSNKDPALKALFVEHGSQKHWYYLKDGKKTSIVDDRVYSTNRDFRFPYCCKLGDPTPLRPLAVDLEAGTAEFTSPDAGHSMRDFFEYTISDPVLGEGIRVVEQSPGQLGGRVGQAGRALQPASNKPRGEKKPGGTCSPASPAGEYANYIEPLTQLLRASGDESSVASRYMTTTDTGQLKFQGLNKGRRKCLACQEPFFHDSNNFLFFVTQYDDGSNDVEYLCLSGAACPAKTRKVHLGKLILRGDELVPAAAGTLGLAGKTDGQAWRVLGDAQAHKYQSVDLDVSSACTGAQEEQEVGNQPVDPGDPSAFEAAPGGFSACTNALEMTDKPISPGIGPSVSSACTYAQEIGGRLVIPGDSWDRAHTQEIRNTLVVQGDSGVSPEKSSEQASNAIRSRASSACPDAQEIGNTRVVQGESGVSPELENHAEQGSNTIRSRDSSACLDAQEIRNTRVEPGDSRVSPELENHAEQDSIRSRASSACPDAQDIRNTRVVPGDSRFLHEKHSEQGNTAMRSRASSACPDAQEIKNTRVVRGDSRIWPEKHPEQASHVTVARADSRASHEKHSEQGTHAIHRPDLEYNERQVLPYPRDKQNIAVRSGLGTGKTEQVLALIQSKKPDAIVSLVHRTSLMTKAARELRGLLPEYTVQTSKECSEGPLCVKSGTVTICQAESACRLDFSGTENLSVLCVLDEVNSILTQLESGTGDVAENITAISDLLTLPGSTNLFLDGYLDQDRLDIISRLSGSRPFTIVNTYKSDSAKKVFYATNLLPKMKQLINDDMYDNKKLCIAVHSKNLGREICAMIQQSYPDKRILMYDAEHRLGDEVDVNEAWSQVDLLVYTATIDCGISFTKPACFDKMYGLFTNYTGVSDAASKQMLGRIRDIKEIYIHCEERAFKQETLDWDTVLASMKPDRIAADNARYMGHRVPYFQRSRAVTRQSASPYLLNHTKNIQLQSITRQQFMSSLLNMFVKAGAAVEPICFERENEGITEKFVVEESPVCPGRLAALYGTERAIFDAMQQETLVLYKKDRHLPLRSVPPVITEGGHVEQGVVFEQDIERRD